MIETDTGPRNAQARGEESRKRYCSFLSAYTRLRAMETTPTQGQIEPTLSAFFVCMLDIAVLGFSIKSSAIRNHCVPVKISSDRVIDDCSPSTQKGNESFLDQGTMADLAS